jgi:hypothetical protein
LGAILSISSIVPKSGRVLIQVRQLWETKKIEPLPVKVIFATHFHSAIMKESVQGNYFNLTER